MYKKILCGTDFSETSDDAVRTASKLALAFDSELTLVHVVAPEERWFEVEFPLADMARYREACLRCLKLKMRKLADRMVTRRVRRKLVILEGQPAQTIDRYATDNAIDLIVVATHGMTNWRHYMMGSVAQKIVQHAAVPVLVVRQEKDKPSREISAP